MSRPHPKTRVLHVIDSLHLGGAQEVVMNLATHGDSARFHHEVATMHGHGVYWTRMQELGIPLHSLSPHKFFPWFIPKLIHLLLNGGFDILHCHLIASNIVAKPIGALCRIPVIINHDHTNDVCRARPSLLLTLDTFSNRFASHIITVSESCRQFLLTREGIREEKLSLIQNAIDTDRYAPQSNDKSSSRKSLGLPVNVPIVAGVGRLTPQKNFSLFVEIAKTILSRLPQVHFVLAGEGPEESLLRRLVAESGCEPHFTFTGYIADTRRIYQAADVLLMPSRYEGLPMTLLEAMSMKRPVVASQLDGIAEVITHGRDGFLVPDGNPQTFADHVTELLTSHSLADSIGQSASHTVATKYSVRRMTSAVEAIYTRFLE